jgi:hypothetical protein
MWDNIDNSQTTKTDASWIAEGLKAETLIWTTDGLYDRKRAANLSDVGWIIFCKKTGLWLTGSFWEKSPTASSFHAEMLGLCSIYLLTCAIAEYHNIETWSAVLQQQTCIKAFSASQRVDPASKKCANIQQSFLATKQAYSGTFTYVHTYSHVKN